MAHSSDNTVIIHSSGDSACACDRRGRPPPPFSSTPRPPLSGLTLSESEIEQEISQYFEHSGVTSPATMRQMRSVRGGRGDEPSPPHAASRSARQEQHARATPPAAEVGGTIKLMRGVLAQKREIQVSHRTGMPRHLDVTSNAAAMAMDILALSKETEYMNDESLRGGIWNFVIPSLVQQRESEGAKFFQIVHYLMLKDSTLMLRGLDFLLFLLGYHRSWESKNKKLLQVYNFQWSKSQKQRMFPNLVATVFEAERCEAVILASRGFVKEQSLIHVRMLAFYNAFKKLYRSGGKTPVPHFRVNNRKLVKQAFKVNRLYWERQQLYLRKRNERQPTAADV